MVLYKVEVLKPPYTKLYKTLGRIYKNEVFPSKVKVEVKGRGPKEKVEAKGFALLGIHNLFLFFASKSSRKGEKV